jgi:hypothetical protein
MNRFLIPVVVLCGCAKQATVAPPVGTDLNGEWMMFDSEVLTLRHTGTNLSGGGRYVSDVVTTDDHGFTVSGNIRNEPEWGYEVVTLVFSATPSGIPAQK